MKDQPQAGFSQPLTEDQAAAYLGCSLSTLRRRRRAGIGPVYFRDGSIIRYRRSDLDDYIAGHLSQAVAS